MVARGRSEEVRGCGVEDDLTDFPTKFSLATPPLFELQDYGAKCNIPSTSVEPGCRAQISRRPVFFAPTLKEAVFYLPDSDYFIST